MWLSNLGAANLNWSGHSDEGWIGVSPADGTLEAWSTAELTVAVEAAGLQAGHHFGTFRIEDPAALNSPQIVSVDLTVTLLTRLESGVAVENVSGDWGTQHYFLVTVPEGAESLTVRTYGGTGDLDLFLGYAQPPDPWWGKFNCASTGWTNEETCFVPSPAPGDWYILILGFTEFEGASLLATAPAPTSGGPGRGKKGGGGSPASPPGRPDQPGRPSSR